MAVHWQHLHNHRRHMKVQSEAVSVCIKSVFHRLENVSGRRCFTRFIFSENLIYLENIHNLSTVIYSMELIIYGVAAVKSFYPVLISVLYKYLLYI